MAASGNTRSKSSILLGLGILAGKSSIGESISLISPTWAGPRGADGAADGPKSAAKHKAASARDGDTLG